MRAAFVHAGKDAPADLRVSENVYAVKKGFIQSGLAGIIQVESGLCLKTLRSRTILVEKSAGIWYTHVDFSLFSFSRISPTK